MARVYRSIAMSQPIETKLFINNKVTSYSPSASVNIEGPERLIVCTKYVEAKAGGKITVTNPYDQSTVANEVTALVARMLATQWRQRWQRRTHGGRHRRNTEHALCIN